MQNCKGEGLSSLKGSSYVVYMGGHLEGSSDTTNRMEEGSSDTIYLHLSTANSGQAPKAKSYRFMVVNEDSC